MKHNEDKWKATYKSVVEKTKMTPSDGLACALATIITIRDGMLDDIGDNPKDNDVRDIIKESLGELCQHLIGKLEGSEKPKLLGFAGNASAAAKAAGFKPKDDASIDVDALLS